MRDAPPPAARPRCLTDEELDAVRGAPTGEAPEALARHLAACERCQERALFGAPRTRKGARGRPAPPSPTRALFLLALMVAAMAAFFYTLRLLAGG